MSKINYQDFIIYHKTNPEIWKEFETLALNLINKGVTRYGAKAIMEVIRYHRTIHHQGDFKINNYYTAFYSRQFAKKYPQHSEFFEYRESNTSKGEKNA